MEAISAIILAGGKSSRMGQDKGLMLLNGKPMIQHVVDTVKPIVSEIIIVANNTSYQSFGNKFYVDEVKNSGPLAGLCVGLKYSETHLNIVLSCDVPYVTTEMLEVLIKEFSQQKDVVLFEKQEELHPLIALYSKTCLPLLQSFLEENELKLKYVLNHLNINKIDGTLYAEKCFKNINTPKDFL